MIAQNAKRPAARRAAQQGSQRISIIIPTYNRRHYVCEAIDSCLAQDRCSPEVIVVDDGSTDDTEKLMGNYAGRIRYMKTPNRGQCSARNEGMSLATGDYVKFLDSDDFLKENSLHQEVAYAEETGADVVCTGWAEFTDAGEQNVQESMQRRHVPDLTSGDPVDLVLQCRGVILSAALYRSSCIQGLRWDPACPKASDWDWFCTVALAGSSFACLDIVSFYYRHHDERRDSESSFYESALHREWQWRKIENALRDSGRLNPQRARWLADRYYLALIPFCEHDRERFVELCRYILCLCPDFATARPNRVASALIRAFGLKCGVELYVAMRRLYRAFR